MFELLGDRVLEAGLLRELTAEGLGRRASRGSVVLGIVRLCKQTQWGLQLPLWSPPSELGVRTIGKLPQRDPCTPEGKRQAHLGISVPSSWSPPPPGTSASWKAVPTSQVRPSPGPQES